MSNCLDSRGVGSCRCSLSRTRSSGRIGGRPNWSSYGVNPVVACLAVLYAYVIASRCSSQSSQRSLTSVESIDFMV